MVGVRRSIARKPEPPTMNGTRAAHGDQAVLPQILEPEPETDFGQVISMAEAANEISEEQLRQLLRYRYIACLQQEQSAAGLSSLIRAYEKLPTAPDIDEKGLPGIGNFDLAALGLANKYSSGNEEDLKDQLEQMTSLLEQYLEIANAGTNAN